MLTDLIEECGIENIGGHEVDVFYTCADELNGFPKTRDKLPSPPSGVAGLNTILGEAFSFTGAPVGSGYWRHLRCIIDTDKLTSKGSQKDGTTNFNTDFEYKVKGVGPGVVSHQRALLACCGTVYVVIPKSGDYAIVVGTRALPCQLPDSEITNVRDNRSAMFKVETSAPIYFMNLTTFPLDIVPNS